MPFFCRKLLRCGASHILGVYRVFCATLIIWKVFVCVCVCVRACVRAFELEDKCVWYEARLLLNHLDVGFFGSETQEDYRLPHVCPRWGHEPSANGSNFSGKKTISLNRFSSSPMYTKGRQKKGKRTQDEAFTNAPAEAC